MDNDKDEERRGGNMTENVRLSKYLNSKTTTTMRSLMRKASVSLNGGVLLSFLVVLGMISSSTISNVQPVTAFSFSSAPHWTTKTKTKTANRRFPWLQVVQSTTPKTPTFRTTTTKFMTAVSSTSESTTTSSNNENTIGIPPPLPNDLRHKYYLLRHGQSTANVAEIISSNATQLAFTNMHGLTELGQEQGRASAQQLLDFLLSNNDNDDVTVIFLSSPFARARQTAQACQETLQSLLLKKQQTTISVYPDILYHHDLRERFFGRLDAQAIYTYAYVWPLDKIDVSHQTFGVESVSMVCQRIRSLLLELEQFNDLNDFQRHLTASPSLSAATVARTGNDDSSSNSNKTKYHIVLVGHADVLQIAQVYAAAAGAAATPERLIGSFSSYRFKNGEVRPVIVNSLENLPQPSPLAAPQRGTHQYNAAAAAVSTTTVGGGMAGPSMTLAQAISKEDSKTS